MSAAYRPRPSNHLAIGDGLRRDLLAWRHHLHAHPELAKHEIETSAFVRARLDALGVPREAGIGGHGVVATLKRGNSERSVGLRADMDALAIVEDTGLPFASKHHGIMHACGHDGHTASLLGAAALLAQDADWEGTVRFIFQPAEEGGTGALAMLGDGLLERFDCERVFAFHNWPGLPAGTLAVRPGPMMACSSRLRIKLIGKAAHAAMAHQGVDPVVAASHVIMGLQGVVSRRVDPLSSAVVSITTMETGIAYNQIGESVILQGTMRFLDPDLREAVENEVRRIVAGIAKAHSVRAEVEVRRGADPTVNAPEEAGMAMRAGEAAGLPVMTDFAPSMGGEDFCWFLQQRPGALVWIGNGPAEDGVQLHSPEYRFNDEILPAAASWLANVAKEALRAGPPKWQGKCHAGHAAG